MPAHITHSIFGNEVLRSQFADEQNGGYSVCGYSISRAAYEWALQGPDILFFAVLAGDKVLPEHGSLMHHSKTDELFILLQQYAVSIKDTPDFRVVFSYICGFICHYIIDKNCHPYVYCMQERRAEENPRQHSIHNKIESDIDSAMARCKFGLTPQRFKISEQLLNDEQIYLPVARLYEYLLLNLYDIRVTAQELLSAFKGSKRYYRIIIDRFGLGIIAKAIDLLSGKRGKAHSMLRVKHYDPSVMNYEHRPWCNLQRPEIAFTQSFDELFEGSKPEAGQLIKKVASLILNETPKQVTYGDSFDNGSPKTIQQ